MFTRTKQLTARIEALEAYLRSNNVINPYGEMRTLDQNRPTTSPSTPRRD